MSDISRAKHWRDRAEELRTIADATRSETARDWLIDIANDLDLMAARLEQGGAGQGDI
jgi:hypothetical protein